MYHHQVAVWSEWKTRRLLATEPACCRLPAYTSSVHHAISINHAINGIPTKRQKLRGYKWIRAAVILLMQCPNAHEVLWDFPAGLFKGQTAQATRGANDGAEGTEIERRIGTRIEAQRRGMGRGLPLHRGRGLGKGRAPSQKKWFWVSIWWVWVHSMGGIFYSSATCFTRKTV